MDYVRITEGKIAKIVSTQGTAPDGEGWLEIDGSSFEGSVGMDKRMLNWDTGCLRSVEALIADGLIEDNRGEYWNEKTKIKLEITAAGQKVPDGYTNKRPPDGEHVLWDESASKWITDRAEVEKARLADIRNRRRYEFRCFDKYQTILTSTLTSTQVEQFKTWRQTWLDAPATGIEPERLDWFREY